MLFLIGSLAFAWFAVMAAGIRSTIRHAFDAAREVDLERWNRMHWSTSGEIRVDESGTRFPQPGATFRGEVRRSW